MHPGSTAPPDGAGATRRHHTGLRRLRLHRLRPGGSGTLGAGILTAVLLVGATGCSGARHDGGAAAPHTTGAPITAISAAPTSASHGAGTDRAATASGTVVAAPPSVPLPPVASDSVAGQHTSTLPGGEQPDTGRSGATGGAAAPDRPAPAIPSAVHPDPQTPPAGPAAVTVAVDEPPATDYGRPVTVTYRLASGSAGVPDARTEISYAGRTSTVTVGRDGRGSVRLATLPVGTTAITVRYPGDEAHRPAATTVTVSVRRAPSEIRSLTVAGSAVSVNQGVSVPSGTAVAVAFDVYSAGAAVAGGTGSVTVGNSVTDVTVDDRGHASATLKDLPVGAHQLLVRYAGDRNRDGAGAPITLTVTDPDATPAPPAAAGDAPGRTSPCPATARACVDLSASTTWLQSAGKITYGPVPITSGRPGHRTPDGTFHVYWKDKDHRSSLFNGAPMPNSVFFVGGIAFHQGSLSVPSHGCIHLSWDASQAYWDALHTGDTVAVFGYAPY